LLGTFVNVLLVLAGGVAGLALKSRVPKRLQKTMMQGLGLSVLLIGIQGALKESDLLAIILCVVVGGLLGEWIDIEKKLESIGAHAERLLARGNDASGSFAKGFMTASLLFCVGAMSIVGPLESGLSGNHTTQIAKGIIDGVVAVFFAASLGPGVLLSAATILVYQGGITLSASVVAPLLSDAVITQMSAVGGLLVAGIGLIMIVDAKIRIGNLLPAIFVPVVYVPLSQWISSL
jgi:hypothetical protein